MRINEENLLANINEFRMLAFELLDKAEKLRKESVSLPSGERRTQAINQILEWTAEADALNTRASELALQMIEDTKEPVNYKPGGFAGGILFTFFLYLLKALLSNGNELLELTI